MMLQTRKIRKRSGLSFVPKACSGHAFSAPASTFFNRSLQDFVEHESPNPLAPRKISAIIGRGLN